MNRLPSLQQYHQVIHRFQEWIIERI
jgi:hypothetical protein